MLDNFYLDPLHNILNKVNLQIVSAVKQSIINRGVAQGMSMYTYASNGTVYKYFDLISLSPASPPQKYYQALNIASTSVARSFQIANDPSKSDQARAIAHNREADGKQSARLLRNNSLIST